MNASDTNKPLKVIGLTLMVFEGDIERDEGGAITNKMREVMHYEAPVEQRNGAELESRDSIVNRVVGR